MRDLSTELHFYLVERNWMELVFVCMRFARGRSLLFEFLSIYIYMHVPM